ncbi:MAG TPA: heme o synthase [Planctomycetota bacterium]|nr:heme o synthase [Planctomycetota bacterium]
MRALAGSTALERVPERDRLEPSWTGAWLALTKPRIALLVALAALVGAMLAAGPGARLAPSLEAALWIACVAAASSVFNQVLERDTDRLMERTASRPLVTGRLRVRDAILFGALLAAAGTAALALRFNALAALLALATLAAYALVYTPLKRVSTLNTVVGALPGAMPPLLGFVALAGAPSGWAWFLFAVLFAWQFPHFMAIAWLYRADYARAGLRMLPCLPGSRGLAGRQALYHSLALLPVSLWPAARGEAGAVYAACALALGLAYIGFSVGFALRETPARARALLLCSLVYLPALFAAVLLDPAVHAALATTTP